MTDKILQSKEELENHLFEQLQFLETSTIAYDKDHTWEAKRIAGTLRLLLHDSSNSHSLLSQLNKKTSLFFDSSLPIVKDSPLSYLGLIAINYGPSGAQPKPILDENFGDNNKFVEFENWWNGIVFIDNKRNTITRKELVLTMADQDGGVHVDPKLGFKYAELSRNNSLGWVFYKENNKVSIKDFERAAIRQIAHEVFKTLNPDYKLKNPPQIVGITVAGVSMSNDEPQKYNSVPIIHAQQHPEPNQFQINETKNKKPGRKRHKKKN
jgi:hypothetical protein